MDESRQPIAGVSVTDKSSGAATISNEEGNYTISITPGDSIEFSHVGYETQVIKPGVNEELDVVLSVFRVQ